MAATIWTSAAPTKPGDGGAVLTRFGGDFQYAREVRAYCVERFDSLKAQAEAEDEPLSDREAYKIVRDELEGAGYRSRGKDGKEGSPFGVKVVRTAG